jgi:hypothetical protein
LVVTLLNILESKRLAFRFWGCTPIYHPEAAMNAGAKIEVFSGKESL